MPHAAPGRAHAETRRAVGAGAAGRRQHRLERQEISTLQSGGIVNRLRAVGGIFAAATGLDAEQTAPLNLPAAPMLQMDCAALRDQIEKGLVIEIFELREIHRAPATLNPKFKIRNPKF